ncbi:hypothetical protein FQN60_018477, partial [Etheostoma spectabile]
RSESSLARQGPLLPWNANGWVYSIVTADQLVRLEGPSWGADADLEEVALGCNRHLHSSDAMDNQCDIFTAEVQLACGFMSYVSDDSSDSPEPGPVTCMEPFLVRRLSCRTVQLPPLAFRQAEQYYCDRKSESDTVTVPPRPTTLSLRTPPLIAITSADTSSGFQGRCFGRVPWV